MGAQAAQLSTPVVPVVRHETPTEPTAYQLSDTSWEVFSG